MAIGLIARVKVAAGKGAEFEAAFRDQAKAVRDNEPGNRLYQLVRARDDPSSYAVMELYDDEAALEAHRNGAHMAANRPRIAPLLVERTVVEVYDAV
jgi:quinol monooxygenase YgiN